jgi:hypothetical protein
MSFEGQISTFRIPRSRDGILALDHLIPWTNTLFGKLRVAQILKKFPASYKTRSFITVFPWPLPHTGLYHTSSRSILISSFQVFQIVSFIQVFRLNENFTKL